jgi:hypothetical protein
MKLRVAHFFVGALALVCTGAISKEEFDCEEAAAYIQHCCPEQARGIQCGAGCEKVTISEEMAQKILSGSCEDVCGP